MRAVLHRTLSVFTSLCLFAGACTIENAGDIEDAGDIERFDVVNTNEIVEDGVSLHTFESKEMTYSIRIHAVRDGIVFHHTVESDGDHYDGSITYEIVTTDDGGAEMHPIGDADVVFGEIYSRVAGSTSGRLKGWPMKSWLSQLPSVEARSKVRVVRSSRSTSRSAATTRATRSSSSWTKVGSFPWKATRRFS